MRFRSHPVPVCSVGSDVRQINFGFSVRRQGKFVVVLQRNVRLCVKKLVRHVIWPAQNAYIKTILT